MIWINNNLGLAIIGLALLCIALALDSGGIAWTTASYLKALARNPEIEQHFKGKPEPKLDEDGNEIPQPKPRKKTRPFLWGYVSAFVTEGVLAAISIAAGIYIIVGMIN